MKIPIIETKQLLLREWRESDLDEFADFSAEEEIAKMGRKLNRDQAWAHLCFNLGHWMVRGFGTWSLVLKSTGELAGFAGLYYPPDIPEPEVSLAIYSKHRRKGLSIEANIASIGYAYDVLGWNTVIAVVGNQNKASIAMNIRLGAKLERPFLLRGMPCTIYRHLAPSDFRAHLNSNQLVSENGSA